MNATKIDVEYQIRNNILWNKLPQNIKQVLRVYLIFIHILAFFSLSTLVILKKNMRKQ